MPLTATPRQLWRDLQRVRSLRIVSHGDTLGWHGTGIGSVVVESTSEAVVVFSEAGEWRPYCGSATRFTNVFRWTLGLDSIGLEHLRFGPGRPVFLFDLTPCAGGVWKSVRPHACGRDFYAAELRSMGSGVSMYWTVTGPTKHQLLEYAYSW